MVHSISSDYFPCIDEKERVGHMSRLLLIIPFILFFVISYSIQCMPSVMCILPELLVMHSDYIVVGKVNNIIEIEGNKYSEISILQTLKSKSKVDGLYYVFSAEKRFICDTSGATAGETYLFFLSELAQKVNIKVLEAHYPLLRDTWNGRGTMLIKTEKSVKYVTVFDIALPKHLRNKSVQSDLCSDIIPLDDLLKYVAEVIDGGGEADY